MKIIKLLRGERAQVSNEDFLRVSRHKWYARKYNHTIYAFATINHELIGLHRFIFRLKKGDKKIVDHINHNGLNNCRFNLQICTHAENLRNRKNPAKGIYRGKNGGWCAGIHLGTFNTKKEAEQIYQQTKKKLFNGGE